MRMVLGMLISAALTGCSCIVHRNADVSLEFRSGSQIPGPGLTKMVVPGTDRPVYVSDEVLLSNADVESARVSTESGEPQIEVIFTAKGAERFASVTASNLMNPLAIFFNGQLISAPVVREKISGGRAVITGSFSEEEAARIAKGIAVQ